MYHVVLFEDDPETGPEIRRRLLPDHLAFLEAHADRITAAGPLAEGDGSPAGGLWLVRADSADAVEALVRADPFWPTGLRRSVRVLAWTQVFADGTRLH